MATAQVEIKVKRTVNGQTVEYNKEMLIDEDTNQEIYVQWYDDEHGGYALDGIGGRPNDRRKK